MPRTRTAYDRDHPCLACGAPWLTVEQAVEAPELRPALVWIPISAGCADRCFPDGSTTAEHYLEAEQERLRRGWS